MVNGTKKQKLFSALGFSILGIFVVALAFVPFIAHAQFTIDSNTPSIFGIMNATDLVSTIVSVVQWILAITGLLAVIVIMYGGFVWMTARGDVEKVRKAKKILINAVIGLVIILFAWVIVYFVVGFVTESTGSTTGCSIGTYVDCQECVDDGSGVGTWVVNNSAPTCPTIPTPHYQVRWEAPKDASENVKLCEAVQAGFDGITPPWLNAGSVTADSVRITDESGTNVSLDPGFAVAADSNAFGYRHNTEWLPNQNYTVEINPITSTDKVMSQVGSVAADNYSWTFTTGTESDENPPVVSLWAPQGNDVCLTPQVQVQFNEPMYAPSITKDNITITPQNPTDLEVTSVFMNSSSSFTANLNKPLNGNTTYTIALSAVAPDGFQDSCGNLLDCGNGLNICDSDGTATGFADDNFSWTFTTSDTTETDCKPEITAITHTGYYSSNGPADAITLDGKNLGILPGTVNFTNKYWNNIVDVTDTIGVVSRCFNTTALPNTAGADPSVACIRSWGDTQIHTIVPAGGVALAALGSGATGGDVTVRRGGTDLSDPNSDFVDQNSPHISRLYPTQGGVGQFVTVQGEKFTNTLQAVYLRKGNYEVAAQTCDPAAWTNNQIVIEIPDDPNFSVGDEILVQVDVDTGAANDGRDRSNLQKFILTSDPPTPGLCTIAPNCHVNAPNTVTLTGKYLSGVQFGYYQATKEHAPTIYNASSVSAVTETSVQVTSPANLPNDTFLLSVDDTNGVSNALTYQVPCTPGAELLYQNTCNISATPPVIPSPNPYPNSQNVCVNLNQISMRFSELIIHGGPPNFHVNQCTSGQSDCTTPVGIGGIVGDPTGTLRVDLEIFTPATFQADTWYQVIASGNITNLSGAKLGDDEVWYFKTKADATPCTADQLAITATDADGLAPWYIDATSTTDYPNTVLYQGNTLTNNCQSVSAAGTYAWSSNDTTVAECAGGVCGNTNQQLVDALQKDGSTIIGATIGSLSATRQLRVHLNYCQQNSDCTTTIDISGVPTTCTSTCNLAQQRCEPHSLLMSPANGPESALTTLRGCYYGPSQGKVFFDATEASYACGPSTWNTDGTEIKVAVPAGFSIGDIPQVTVETATLLTSNGLPFTINGLCSNGEPLPATGVPPGLCSIAPPTNIEGGTEVLRGVGLPDGSGTQDAIEFNGVTALPADTVWTSSTEATTKVPVGATSGDVIVNATSTSGNVCPSNPTSFTVTCNSNNQCGTGCCFNHECVASGICSSGAVGSACQIDNPYFASDLLCNSGQTAPVTAAGKEYRCLSTTGFSQDPVKPVPPSGTQCIYCCDPDQDGNPATIDPQTFVDPVTSANLTCVKVPVGAGVCESDASGTGRGLFCGCINDSQCGTGSGCSSQNDPTGQRCCRARPASPTIITTSPIQCLNAAIVVDFGEQMDKTSINSTTVVFEHITPAPVHQISGAYYVNGSQLTFQPSERLTPGATIQVFVTTNVKNYYGISPAASFIGTVTVDAAAQICRISAVNFDWSTSTRFNIPPPGLFTCAQPGGCAGDTDTAAPNTNGNQNDYFATAVDNEGNPIGGPITYHWEESDPADVYELDALCPNDTAAPFACSFTSHPRNGTGAIRVTAADSDPTDEFDYGSATKSVNVTTFLCERPWPDPYTQDFPYEDATYNASQSPNWDFHFSLSYCRSDGDLPDLHIGTIQGGITAPLVDSFMPTTPSIDELLRQYAFFVTDSLGNRVGADTIGIRVMENELNLPPDLWYKRVVGEDPHGQTTTVDGFPALRVGRSTYVAMTNVSGAVMYPNMFIISYSDEATSDTVEIYNQLLKNIRFNTNSAPENLAFIRRDVQRVQDLNRTGLALSDYKKLHGDYPALAAGSYIDGFTITTWPSWLQTFAATLRASLPVDPQNYINMCTLSYGVQTSVQYTNQYFSGIGADTQGRLYFVNYAYSATPPLPSGERKNLYRCDANLTNCQILYRFGDAELPVGVGLDKSTGDILVASQAVGPNQGISRFDPNNPTVRKALYPMTSAAHVATDPQGNMYVTRTNTFNGIYKYDSNGNLLTSIEYPASWCGTGNCPRDLEFSDNQLYVVDHDARLLSVYDSDLQLLKSMSLSMITDPLGLAIGTDSLYVSNHWGGIYEIEKDFSGIRNIISYSSLANPYELYVNDKGLYVTNYSNHSIDLLVKNQSANSTCWDEVTRTFAASSGSRLYAYRYNGNDPVLYTNLEYLGPGTWRNIAQDTDACASFPNGTCPTFNYQWGAGAFESWSVLFQTTGVPDTTPPTINSFTVPNPLTGTTTITVDATDAGSGVDRALFYINGDLKYTAPGSNLSWVFNPSSYLDGNYTFSVRVFDKAGNYQDGPNQVVTITKTVNDQLPPSLSNFTFQPIMFGVTVQGTINLRVTATDSQANDTGIARVEYYLGTNFVGSCLAGDPCETDNYHVIWDTTAFEDGAYPIYAVGFDNAGNTAFLKRDIELDNGVDTQLPSVFITNPAPGEVAGVVQVVAQAADNQGVLNVLLEMSVDGGSTWMNMTSTGSFPNPDTSVPYSWAWNTNFDPSGTPIVSGTTVTLRATATDINGLTRSVTRDVVVNNFGASNPTAWFIKPTDGQIFSPGLFEVFASDNVGVDHVDVYAYTGADFSNPAARHLIGTVSGGNPYQVSWDPTLPDGVYGMRAIAYNTNNLASNPADPGASVVVTIDRTPPLVSAFTPPDGTTVSGTVNFSITSSDLNGIVKSGVYVWPFIGFVGSDCVPGVPVSPYNCIMQWNTLLNPAVDDGGYWFVAYAIDRAGNFGSLLHQNMTVDNNAGPIPGPDTTPPTDPSIVFNPVLTNNWAKGTETITASSSDSESGIQYVDILIDGVVQDNNADGHTCTSSPCNWVWDTTTASLGQHTVSAGAVDNEGNVSNTVTMNVGVDNVMPLVFLQAPGNNYYVAGTVAVIASATDGATPPASGVARVQFYINDPNNPANLIGEDTTTPYNISWNTTLPQFPDGDYTLFAVVFDNAGNRVVSASRLVHVYNANPSLICGTLLCGGSATSCCNNNACYDPAVSQCCNGSVIPRSSICNIVAPR